ncbi:MAG: DUF1822 family protein [Cyanobacteria bacterium P01_G01_bin.39]
MNFNQNDKSELFQINIPLTAHIQAKKFCCYQRSISKARQVYFNTLAVAAANSYLNLIGWSSSLEQSDSWNPTVQMMMDIADLEIPSYGKLECRAVLSGQNQVIIPPEVWQHRIGYVVVMLDESLKQATLLGFMRQVKQTKIPLSQLESLDKFPTYLCQQKRSVPTQVPSLSSWMSGALAQGWQQLDELFTPQIAMNFRNKQKSIQPSSSIDVPEVSKVKLIHLGRDLEQTIALMLDIQPQSKSEFKVSVGVCNHSYDNYLPEGLELVIADGTKRPVMIAQANETKTIEFIFSGELGEKFSIEVSWEGDLQIENFTI